MEPGTDSKRRHIAHIALFYLDRLLGVSQSSNQLKHNLWSCVNMFLRQMFQTVPSTGRILSLQEMQRGHFSSVLNEVKKRFAARLTPDGTLHGSMSAWINHDVGIKRKLSISPNIDLAWAISPLTRQQKNDLEYLMVMWLGRLNQAPGQFLCAQGKWQQFDIK